MVRDDKEQALFVNQRGDRLTRQGLWQILKAYAKSAGFGPAGYAAYVEAQLRHAYA